MAQLVEHNLAKVGVAGSSPVVRSIAFPDRLKRSFLAKWPSGKAEACKAFTPGSNPGFASRTCAGARPKTDARYSSSTYADMAQLVEHNLAKVGVAGSSPVVRSKNDSPATELAGLFCMPDLTVASTFVFK